ncbi:MAG: GNAT family N-acetyltransferase [Thiobacillus sp.]
MNEVHPGVRRLTPQDVDAVSTLARVVWQATYPALISQAQIDAMLDDRYSPARIVQQLDIPRHAWWVAQQNQVLVGFAHATLNDADCKLDKLYVHPDSQHQGIGSTLLHAVQGWARQQQAGRLWLQVNRANTQAISAYQKYGFHIIKSRVFDIGNGFVMDDFVLEQAL